MEIDDVWRLLDQVKDPEIPVVTIVELGMVRAIQLEDRHVTVVLAPTFAGCPALHVIQEEVIRRLYAAGASKAEVHMTFAPPWSSDDITPQARQKLIEIGLAPPPKHQGFIELALLEPALCPYCGSSNTTIKNSFGPTLCRAIYYCYNCQQPFEQFKPL
jgi:ring-1,2-phenylacetyl-CoA epoxidase subunit PaaD